MTQESQRTFTQEQAQAMYKALLVAYKSLHSDNYQQIAFAQGYVGECLDTLHAIASSATPAPEGGTAGNAETGEA